MSCVGYGQNEWHDRGLQLQDANSPSSPNYPSIWVSMMGSAQQQVNDAVWHNYDVFLEIKWHQIPFSSQSRNEASLASQVSSEQWNYIPSFTGCSPSNKCQLMESSLCVCVCMVTTRKGGKKMIPSTLHP